MNATHPLQDYEQEIEYFRSLVSIQSDPYRFNALQIPIEERVATIIGWIKKESGTARFDDVEFAFTLLEKYTSLWLLYFKNHPWRYLNG